MFPAVQGDPCAQDIMANLTPTRDLFIPRVHTKSSSSGKKRLRHDSSSEFSVEELFPDEMGYDADIEALHPDTYEEPDSDVEQSDTPRRKKFFSIDEELAARMKNLGSERSGTNSPQTPYIGRGRKRRSLHEEVYHTRLGHSSDLEITEVLERPRSHTSPPRKRRRRSPAIASTSKDEDGEVFSPILNNVHGSDHKVEVHTSGNDAMDMT